MVWITRMVTGLINFFVALVEIFLVLRVALRFFAANPDNGFVQFIYNSSDVLLQPFRGIFPATNIGNNHIVDFTALFAMVVYGLFGLALAALLWWLTPSRYVSTTVRDEPVATTRRTRR